MGETNPQKSLDNNLPIFQRSMIRISITRLKLPKDTSRSFHVVAINDKNLDYEIETPLPRFGLDLVGLEGWKEKEGWKDGGN